MTARRLEFLVEEASMEAFLHALLPRFLPQSCRYAVHPFNGKPDLLRKLPQRLQAYRSMLSSGSGCRIVVVLDRDQDDCHELKSRLEEMARDAGLQTRSTAQEGCWQVANRLAIEELEAWYFGDWATVCAVYQKVSPNIPKQERFRDPDGIKGTWEAFQKVLQRRGYYPAGLNKIEAAQKIGAQIQPSRCRSRSFQVFWTAVLEAVQEAKQ